MPPVRVLIVTFNHADEIAACVESALAQRDTEVDVVVADNASSDGTADVLGPDRDGLRVLRLPANDGYAAGSNRAYTAAADDGDVLLLNPDVVMDPDCVATLRAHLAGRPQCGAVAALLRNADGSLQRFAVREPDLRAVALTFTHVGRRLDIRRGGPARAHRHYEDIWAGGFAEPVAVDCPAAACVLIRRAAVTAPLMDERLPLFFNDAELWRRIRDAGWAVEVSPHAGAMHEGGTSIRRTDPVRIRAEWVVTTRRYVGGHRGPLARAVLSAIFAADAVASLGLLAARRGDADTATWLRGTLGGLGLPGGPPPWLTPVRRVVPARRRHRVRPR